MDDVHTAMIKFFDYRYPDWEYHEDSVTCPCGYPIELDGTCPEGCVSPFLQEGMI